MILAGVLCLQVKENEHRLEEVPMWATRKARKVPSGPEWKLGLLSLERRIVWRVLITGKKEDNIVLGYFGSGMNAGRHLWMEARLAEEHQGDSWCRRRGWGSWVCSTGRRKSWEGYYCLSPVTSWVVTENRGSHSSFSEMHSDRLRGSRHSLRQRKFQLDMRKGS